MTRATGTILVAGGGIGGLMAALALAKSGLKSLVLERAEAFTEIGAGVQLGPNATRLLAKWQVLDRLAGDLVAPDEVRVMDAPSGRTIGRIPLGLQFKERFGAPYQVVHRADLHRALFTACTQQPEITLKTGVSVSGYTQSADGVALHGVDGRVFKADALIAADGLRSVLREQMLGDGTPDFAGHTAYRALLPRDAMPADCAWNAAALWASPGGHLVHYPISGGERFNIVAITASRWRGEGWNEKATGNEVLEQFRNACPQLRSILEAGRDYRKWSLADRPPVHNWSEGRVTLLGDAAHPVLPYLAQGAAMAIEDADCIAESLEQAGGDAERAFALYEAARRPRTAQLYKASRFQGGIYHAGGIKRLIRNQIMQRQSADQWYKRVDWIYSGP